MTTAATEDGHGTLQLPALGLGCWAFGGGRYWGAQQQSDVDAVVSGALDAGVNYFDTAESYNDGASEESLGRALRGRRAHALIGSKVSPNNAYPRELRAHCEQSLRRLGTDYLDLYMIHWPLNRHSVSHFTSDAEVLRNPPTLEEAMHEMELLRREGKVRHVGLSNHGPVQMAEAAGCGVPIVANEIPYNLLMRAAEDVVLPYCAEHGILTLGYSALMQGLLARPVASLGGIPAVRLRTRHFAPTHAGSRHGEPGAEETTLATLAAIARISSETGRTVAELALGWALADRRITCTLVGCRNVAQLAENLGCLARPLDPETKQTLDEATDSLKRELGSRIDYFQGPQTTRSW